jgi:hypothetical protein
MFVLKAGMHTLIDLGRRPPSPPPSLHYVVVEGSHYSKNFIIWVSHLKVDC